ncbi:MAG: hypothetical protein U0796_17290 [Gemmatales bacterium]
MEIDEKRTLIERQYAIIERSKRLDLRSSPFFVIWDFYSEWDCSGLASALSRVDKSSSSILLTTMASIGLVDDLCIVQRAFSLGSFTNSRDRYNISTDANDYIITVDQFDMDSVINSVYDKLVVNKVYP